MAFEVVLVVCLHEGQSLQVAGGVHTVFGQRSFMPIRMPALVFLHDLVVPPVEDRVFSGV